ncbi:hypothetical protein CIG19_16705 [Enterobacterales bacterium CwR94]|nr:hypothetical protein CIG19_16705 [Enterobacterales bacterium CwR94]
MTNEQSKDEIIRQLTEQVNAMAAENVALKDGISDITFMDDESFLGSTSKAQAVMGRLVNIKTPATDAIINSIRAEGAIEVRNALITGEDGSDIYAIASEVVGRLRNSNKSEG